MAATATLMGEYEVFLVFQETQNSLKEKTCQRCTGVSALPCRLMVAHTLLITPVKLSQVWKCGSVRPSFIALLWAGLVKKHTLITQTPIGLNKSNGNSFYELVESRRNWGMLGLHKRSSPPLSKLVPCRSCTH